MTLFFNVMAPGLRSLGYVVNDFDPQYNIINQATAGKRSSRFIFAELCEYVTADLIQTLTRYVCPCVLTLLVVLHQLRE